ncbi:hypothetical protein [Schaalia odontolytica]|uniref:hypothetical protein n=1 Tax=Schaalia odontolytica TaxID=1660 RepID=UPI001D071147|nr:hypothetical protein [Schaalia odontolytica]MCB6401966.1 hypothetical protein [Schaalia odontolytica]
MYTSPDAQAHTISHEAIYTWIYAHPKKTLIEHGICLPSRRWMRKKPQQAGANRLFAFEGVGVVGGVGRVVAG